jgi:hypothetical protein
LGEPKTGNCYLISNDKPLQILGELEDESDFSAKGVPVLGVKSRDKVHMISHRETDEDFVVMHVYDLKNKAWTKEKGSLGNAT